MFASIRHETSRQTFKSINGHSADYVLSAVCEFLSRRLSTRSLPQHCTARSGTLIVNTDPHTESGSHWLAIHFQPRSHSSHYFDSYGLPPYITSIQSFLKRNSSVRDYNAVQLQGPNSMCVANTAVSSYMDRGYTPKQFVIFLATATADKLVSDMLESVSGPLRDMSRGGQCSGSRDTT